MSSPAATRLIAFFWGFAEATAFFIVPDVFTSRVALTHGASAAFRSCAWAVLGALIGGTLLFSFARFYPAAAASLLRAFDYIPGISPALIETARLEIVSRGSFAFFTTSAAGIPYKVCTLQASLHGIGYGAFLVMSVLARSLRFVAVTSIALLCQRFVLHRLSTIARTRIHFACWAAFYVWYFHAMSA